MRRRLLLVSGGFASLAVLAVVANPVLLRVDAPLSEWVRGESLADLFRSVSMIGATETAVAVGLVVAVVTWRRCRAVAVAFVATLAVGAVLNVVLKVVIDRPRPPDPDPGVALASFPSGHTFQATILLGLLPLAVMLLTGRPWVGVAARVLATVGVVGVAISRVYLGAHWPLDVVGGALVGIALIQVTHLGIGRWHRAGRCRCTAPTPAGT